MQKVNVFAQYPHGGSFYKSVYCSSGTTINEIISKCNLSTFGASVYLNSIRLSKAQWDDPLYKYKTTEFAFLSLRYGESTESRKARQ
jgi:hypothetical protein